MSINQKHTRPLPSLILTMMAGITAIADDGATFRAPRSGGDIVSLPSVEAAALCRHTEHSVNHSTGQASIAMPLYTLKCGDMSLPLSLNYATGGVKVDDEDGPVGATWDLQCGGVVSRRIVGRPDGVNGPVNIPAGSPTLEYLTALDHYTADSDYDRYNYRAGSYSGTFIIKGGKVIQLPETDVKITLTDDNTFRIITPDGTEYVYDVTETVSYRFLPMILDSKLYSPDYSDITCQWRLGRIINPSRTDSIMFEYVDMASRRRDPSSQASTISANDRNTSAVSISYHTDRNGTNRHEYTYDNRHGLNRITCRTGSINFINAEKEPIGGFTVNAPSGKEVRRVVFGYMKYDTKTKKDISMLKSVTISADGKEIDGATFKYYIDGSAWLRSRDIFGYNNFSYRINNSQHSLTESILDVAFPKSTTTPRDTIVTVRPGDIIQPGELIENPEPAEPDNERAHIVISEQRLPCFDALRSMSLHSFTTYAGATTEFDYEMNEATRKFSIDGNEYAIAPGLRIKREQTTDHNTGNVRVREYSYTGGVSTIDFSKISQSAFIGLSGCRGLSGATTIYYSTGAVLATSSLMPGDVIEDATVYYSNVRETVTGTGLDCPVITDYVFDTSKTESPYVVAGKRYLSEAQVFSKRYCGTNITINSSGLFTTAYSRILSPQFIGGYFRQTFREKAPLVKKTEWVADNCGAPERPLRVTDYVYSSGEEKTYTTGYYSVPLVRTIDSSFLGLPDEDYQSIDDFNYFPVTVATCKTWCDSVRTTEYDSYGNARTVVTAYEYNDRIVHSRPTKGDGNTFETDSTRVVFPGEITSFPARYHLISRISKSCGGDVYTTDYQYSCNALRGLLATATARGRISLPVKETYRHGGFMLEKRYSYADFGAGAGNLQLSSIVCAADGSAITDSISVTSYDRYGNPLATVDFRGITTGYGWGDRGTYLQKVSTGNYLTTGYEYAPLTGYTAMTSPASTSTLYSYSAGRLSSVTTVGDVLARYSYSQYGTDRVNKIVTTRTGVNGNSITEIARQDAFGNLILKGTAGSNGRAIVNVTDYDIAGRKLREYFPMECDNPDGDLTSIAQSGSAVYDGDSEAFQHTVYMPGNDGRRRSVTIGGEEFASHPMRFDYRFNSGKTGSEPTLCCRRYRIDGNRLCLDGHYPAGSLAITEATDGDGRQVLTFTDFSGKTILSRTVAAEETADTYSIYDDGGNLTMVLQPLASSALSTEGAEYDISTNLTLRDYADYYRYDSHQRLVEQRMAGTEPIKYWHDAAGRVIFTQDGEQRARGVAGFAIDDIYGRRALEGEAVATAAMLSGVSGKRPYALRTETLAGRHAGYGVSLSMTGVAVDKAYYYDDYGFLSEACCAGLDSVLTLRPLKVKRGNNRGLLTGMLSRVTGAADFDGSVTVTSANCRYVASAMGYDGRERVAVCVSVDPQGVEVRESVTYSASGLPTASVSERRDMAGGTGTLSLVYGYDDLERQTSVTASVDGVEMARSTTAYDGIGRTESVSLADMRSDLSEKIGYTYITNGAVSSIATASGSMAMTMRYASGAKPSYSGYISGMDWTGADRVKRSYSYGYDGMSRLVSADYSESGRPLYSHLVNQGTPDYSCAYRYDLNGNPLSVVRKGLTEVMGSGSSNLLARFGTVDNLTMSYSGNRVTKVTDSAANTTYTGASDFYDNNYREEEYEYDANGNMTLDFNRKIMGVVYNRLNQPVRIEIGGDTFVENMYDADGTLRQRRLRQRASSGLPTIGGFFPADSIDAEGYHIRVTDYCGPWETVNGRLSAIRIPGGYIEGDNVYFNITDHQGNIRQVWNASSGETVQDNHYYPYGAPFGESASTEFVKAMARTRQSEISTNQYKYSAKEWMPAFGLNLYDFSARQYDPILCHFTSPDPLNFNYPQLSPYLYCAANPINYSDPTGLAAIYNSSGMFVGNTKEGFTGQIYIYDGSEEIDFSKYYEYQLSSLNIYIRKYDDVANLLSSNAQTAIWNNIIFHFEGMNIFGEIFRMNRIEGGGIKYRHGNDETITWGTVFNLACGIQLLRPRIYGTGNFIKVYEATVENIVLSVLVHEWYSHGIMNYCDMDNTHRFAYQNIIRYEPFWNMTTDKYKRAVLFEFIRYTFSETGSISLFISFFNYFKKICTIELNT